MSQLNLAIETSASQGWVTVGLGDAMIETAPLPQQRRHNIELMPTIAGLVERHGFRQADLSEVYVSLGPGSFTGLRIALATVKMLAFALEVKVVGVPSLEVIAHNAPAKAIHVAAGLNLKRGTMHSQVFQRASVESTNERVPLTPITDARLRPIEVLLKAAPRPVTLIGETLPDLPNEVQRDSQITVLPAADAAPRSEVVWRLGRKHAARDDYDDPAALNPLYIREPEAVTLWREKQRT